MTIGTSEIQDCLLIHSGFETILGYIRPCLKRNVQLDKQIHFYHTMHISFSQLTVHTGVIGPFNRLGLKPMAKQFLYP